MAAVRSRRRGSRGRRPTRSAIVLRWLAVAGVVLVAFLYVRPIKSYLHASDALGKRQAEIRVLRVEKRVLEQRLATARRGGSLLRNARRLGLVRPGERLFIVKGIDEWREARARGRRARHSR